MKLSNFHSHTILSDGENTPEEMVQAAVFLGLSAFGISDHSSIRFDPDCCMAYENYDTYKRELTRLKEEYKDRIRLFMGIEQDYYSDYPAEGFDYIIGSVHYLKLGDEYVPVDYSGEKGAGFILDAAEKYFGGDIYKLLAYYFETVEDVVNKTGADIIGHFDVISKANEVVPFFDPQDPRYLAAWKKAADQLLKTGKIFEINLSQVL
ncbi:MAG: PHP domain-containing protein, partial [Parasporobacterium sp.]|nr:PHP domain-containing protein [Parasporobacterium sp.]